VSPDPRARIARDVVLAFVRVHVLHHACEAPIFGVEMMDELRRHGYRIGPGTLYPLLHAMEEAGVLSVDDAVVDGKTRRYYRATRTGERLLRELRSKLRELLDEVMKLRRRRGRGALAPAAERKRGRQ
jgi:DNA-binding PadR family transcriptional regulator